MARAFAFVGIVALGLLGAANAVTCPTGQYDNGGVCAACDTCASGQYISVNCDGTTAAVTCANCDTASSNSCLPTQHFLINALCTGIQTSDPSACVNCKTSFQDAYCTNSQYFDDQSGSCGPTSTSDPSSCEECDAACFRCTGPSNGDCISCAVGYQFDSNQDCIACSSVSCGEGEYEVPCTMTQDTHCAPCFEGCGVCTGPGMYDCESCAAGKVSYGNDSRETPCCDPDQIVINKQCTTCAHDCSDGFFETACVSAHATCAPCHGSCSTCTGPSAGDCEACAANTFASGGLCSDCSAIDATACAADEYLKVCSADSDAACAQCDSSCDGCTGGTSADCVACATGFYSPNSECVLCDAELACDADQFRGGCSGTQDSVCEDCDQSCDGCTAAGNTGCKACAAGYSERATDGACVLATGAVRTVQLSGQEAFSGVQNVNDTSDQGTGSRESIIALCCLAIVAFLIFLAFSLSGKSEASVTQTSAAASQA